MFLGDRDGGEGLDFLFVRRRGACVFKLIEELKEKRPECRELGRQARPLAPEGSEMQGGVTCKSTKAVFFLVPRPPHKAEPHALPTHLHVQSGSPCTQGSCSPGDSTTPPNTESPTQGLVPEASYQLQPEGWVLQWQSMPQAHQRKASQGLPRSW